MSTITPAQQRVLTAVIVNGIAPTRSRTTTEWCLVKGWIRKARVDVAGGVAEPGYYAITDAGRSALAKEAA